MMSSRRLKLGIVVPLANEQRTIVEFLDRVRLHLQPGDRIFCVLDRTCRDNTLKIIQSRSQTDSGVELVWAPENRSVVDAYFRGYRAAFEHGCEWILEMDGGLSHLPEEIPLFIQGMEQGYDYVGGYRFMPGGSHQSRWTRVFLSRGGTLLTNRLLHTRMSDMTGGFQCFNRKAMAWVLEHGVTSRANFFQTEIRHMMHLFKWKEVPITYRNDKYGTGRSSILEAMQILWALRKEKQKQLR